MANYANFTYGFSRGFDRPLTSDSRFIITSISHNASESWKWDSFSISTILGAMLNDNMYEAQQFIAYVSNRKYVDGESNSINEFEYDALTDEEKANYTLNIDSSITQEFYNGIVKSFSKTGSRRNARCTAVLRFTGVNNDIHDVTVFVDAYNRVILSETIDYQAQTAGGSTPTPVETKYKVYYEMNNTPKTDFTVPSTDDDVKAMGNSIEAAADKLIIPVSSGMANFVIAVPKSFGDCAINDLNSGMYITEAFDKSETASYDVYAYQEALVGLDATKYKIVKIG